MAKLQNQINVGVKFCEPDWSLAYANLSVRAVEAFAYLDSGDTEKAMKALREAKAITELTTMMVAEIPEQTEAGSVDDESDR